MTQNQWALLTFCVVEAALNITVLVQLLYGYKFTFTMSVLKQLVLLGFPLTGIAVVLFPTKSVETLRRFTQWLGR
jgi:hypothetical protein